MSKTAFSGAILAAICMSASAQAADIYGSRPYAQQPYTVSQPLSNSWMGPYIGGNIGYAWGDITHNATKPAGVLGGIQAGYNWQSGALVFGIEGDLQINGAEDTFAPWKFSNPWFGTARGRVGYAFNNVLLYGTGGLAFGGLKGESFLLSESHTGLGWTLGVGAEIALNQRWSAKIEYLYVDLSDRNFSITGMPNGYEFNTLRVGVNYRF
ncbi:outer membrane protein [Bradyrhizobium sp. SYSU BS000235]|uniref:outer membrane protein n=1 Tax=Bradyrhizobium sp. SYSU BS000235 TaxID=3411332 RepID=UPI003C72B0EA